MVAIAILLVAVVTPVSLIGDSLHNLYYARDQMVAINLAQEGIEAVRQKRDSNLLAGAPTSWDSGLSVGDYRVGADSTTLLSFCGESCGVQMVYLNTQGFYEQSAVATPTQFKRIVTITGTGDERRVDSTVTWQTGGQQGTITVTEYIFKWL